MILPDHRVPQNIPKPNCHHLPPIRIFGYIIFIIYWDMFGACTQFFFIDTPRYQVSILFLNHNLFVALLLFAEHLKLGPLHFELHGQSTLTQLGGFKVLRHRRICTCGWEILRYPREVWKSNFRQYGQMKQQRWEESEERKEEERRAEKRKSQKKEAESA